MVSSADPLSISPLPYIPIQRRLVQNRSLFLVLFLAVVGFNRLFTCSTSSSSSSINAPLESKGIHETETGTESEEQYQGKDYFLKNTWPSLRQALCGDGHPNARRKQLLQRVVFQLARDEVFEADDPTIANRTFRAGNGGPTELVNLFFNFDFRSSVYYGAPNHFQTIYMHIWKGASQQIHDMEIELFSHKQRFKGTYKAKPGALKDALKNVGIIDNTEIEEVPSRVEMKDPPPPLPTPPCIYTAIRDPISHFLSGYNQADFRMLTWNEFANSSLDSSLHPHGPYHYAVPYTPTGSINNTNKAAVEHLHNRRKERFEAFVKDLLREEKNLAKNQVYRHAFSMTKVLSSLAKHNQTLTAYIPTLENITSTWPAFISKTCPGAPPLQKMPKPKPKLKIGHHPTSNDPLGLYQAAKDVWKEGGSIARALCLLHAFDYACWEDLPAGIPDLCIEVYHKHAAQIFSRYIS